MKKVLFLSYNYPYGGYGASTQCSLRIMSELASSADFEVHCVSFKGDKTVYPVDSRINIHKINIPKEHQPKSIVGIRFRQILTIPIFPLNNIVRTIRIQKATLKLIENNHFDLAVSQCYPLECVLTGVFIKKKITDIKHLTIFWDNLYGKSSLRIIPHNYALRRQKKLESWIANNSDKLVSLYPLKPFHDKYGDVPEALGKRVYLGIPSILPPQKPINTEYTKAVVEGKVNILYSGSIIRPEYMDTVVDLFNQLPTSEDINLIFFSRGYSNAEFDQLKKKFKGTIQNMGYIPNRELLSVYNYVDFFMSFPGDVNSIRSKCYEYMSYGRPMILFYNDERDVNIKTFSKYPLFKAVDIERDGNEEINALSDFLKRKGDVVNFDEVEKLFPLDSPKAYVELINRIINSRR